ncbi:MAG: hypothetical protein C0619_11350 [Desulfuromonas sp.]|nr:MAG: hypothetical protein C0619_11350 [Desulfuromonas sp.]
MQFRLIWITFVVLLLVLPERLPAAGLFPETASGPVELEADQLSFDEQSGRYLARGNVRLKRGALQLTSDELWWNRASDDLEARGNVVLDGEQDRLVGDRVRYNLTSGTGLVEEGQAFLGEQNLFVSGSRIEKRGEAEYRIIDGSFTTCEADNPSWKFSAKQLDVTVGGYARARHTVFYLKGVPSFYLPYLLYPAKTERESGLLMPRVGYSDKRGMEFSAAYYQVISRNQDATLYLDYLSELGVGKGLEYRYVFGRDNAGQAHGYHIDAEEGEENQYALAWEHQGTLPGRVRLSVDGEYVSERDFFDDFGEEADDYNKAQTVSELSLSRSWGVYNLVGQLRYTENLQVDTPSTLQWLPRVSLDAVRHQVAGSPFYFAFASEYTYFWREEGLKAQRLSVRPALLLPMKLWKTLDLVPELGWTERHYWTSSEGSGHEQQGLYDFSTRLSSRFYRIYSRGVETKVRHLLEPELIYIYVPDVDQEDLPEFDRNDRIEESHRVEYGLTQRVTTRSQTGGGRPEYRDQFFFRLSQSYDLNEDGDIGERFSPLRGQLAFDPFRYFQLAADSRYDLDLGRWLEYSGAGTVHDQRGNRLQLEYRSRRPEALVDEFDYGSLDLDLAWLKPVYLGYRNRYDFVAEEQLEQVLDVEYRHQCWSLLLTFREREDDQSVMVSFSLGGIGTVGSLGADMGGS